MFNTTALGNLGGTLIHNSICTGIAFVVLLILSQVVMRIALRIANLVLRSKVLAVSAESQDAGRRTIRGTTLLMTLLATLGLIGVGAFATWRQVRIGIFLRDRLYRMEKADWIALGLAAAKTLGVIALAFVLARVIRAVLQLVSDRLLNAASLASRRQRLVELLHRLRQLLSCALVFGTLLICGRLVALPEGLYHFIWSLAYLITAIYAARFAVGATHLVIDVVFELSDALTRLENPLRYLGRFRHLAGLTKSTTDYFIYVGLATLVIDQLRPGTWASTAGRLAIRIIAIFYFSRVLVEICQLFINEFFLNSAQRNEPGFQQRQTLVPVASGFLRYSIYFSAVVMALREAGIDPTPLLAGAGVAGVAIGLGAQAFVGDIVAGFFILFENLFLVGDYIEVSGVKGRVEEIGVRVTKLRDDAGVLHAIPNGEVRKVSSHSKGYVNVVVDLLIPYEHDIHKVISALEAKTTEVRAEEPGVQGLTSFDIEDLRESAVLLRTTTMVKAGTDNEMAALLRLAFLEALIAAGVPAPYARRLLVISKQSSGALPTDPQ
jgi:small conductance mechanosensitive channel